MKPDYKHQKYCDLLKEEIALWLRQKQTTHLNHPSPNSHVGILQFISITRVELSSDHSWAKIYWDSFRGDIREEADRLLDLMRRSLKFDLSKKLTIRKIPDLFFLYDSQFEDEVKIESLLKKQQEDEEAI